MPVIGLISDTHNFLHPKILAFLNESDEIWHAGDIGSLDVINRLQKLKPIKAVWGNIDGQELRHSLPKTNIFLVDDIKVVMTHIGGYPGRYQGGISGLLKKEKPGLFVCGHSHILKVIYDQQYQLLHINPGAAGKFGSHKVLTAVRFQIEGKEISNLEILEIERE
jgi:putative phosphoesterase